MPIGRIVTHGGMEAVRQYYRTLPQRYTDALNDMLVLDAVIMNTDRHFGNFGFLLDNNTNKIIEPAPLFDHGNSLLNFAGNDAWESEDALNGYTASLLPCVYDDFINTAREVLTAKHREGLRKLLTFRFKKHSRYNIGNQRLKMLETQIRQRAKLLSE